MKKTQIKKYGNIAGAFMALLFLLTVTLSPAPASSAVIFQNANGVTSGYSSVGSTASTGSTSGFFGLVNTVKNAINVIMPVVVSLAVLWLIWGIFQLVRSNNEGDRKEATTMLTYGIIYLFVMVSVWGLVNLISYSFNLDKTAPSLPQIPSY